MPVSLSRVLRGQSAMGSGTTILDVALPVTLSALTKSLLVYTYRQGNPSSGGARGAAGALIDENTIRFSNPSGIGLAEAVFEWGILEFTSDSSISVYHSDITFLGGTGLNQDVPVPRGASVNVGRTIVFGNSAITADTVQGVGKFVLRSPTTVRVDFGGRVLAFQVAEFFDRSSIQTGNVSSSDATVDVSLAPINRDWAIPVVGTNSGSNRVPWIAFLRDNETLRITQQPHSGAAQTANYEWAVLHAQWIKASPLSFFEEGGSDRTTIDGSGFSTSIGVVHNPHILKLSSAQSGVGGTGLVRSDFFANTRWAARNDGDLIFRRNSSFSTSFGAFNLLQAGIQNPDLIDEFEVIDTSGLNVTEFPDRLTFRKIFGGDFEGGLETLCEVISEVTARLGDRFDISRSRASFYVNQAYLEVANMAPHDALETIRFSSVTTGSTQRLRLPPDYSEPLSLSRVSWGANGPDESGSRVTLQRIGNQELAGLSAASGEPQKYALFDTFVEIWPSPASNYSLEIRYKQYPSVLTACDDKLALSAPWRQAVFYRAEQRLAEFIGDDTHAARAQNQFTGYVQTLDSDFAKRQKDKQAHGLGVAGYTRPRRKRPGRGRFSDPDFDRR